MTRQRISEMFPTRNESWQQAGLAQQVDTGAYRRACVRGTFALLIFVATLVLHAHRDDLFNTANHSVREFVAQLATALILLVSGWIAARDIGRAAGPMVMRRMDPATAGAVAFAARLVVTALVIVIVLHTAGIDQLSLTIAVSLIGVIFGLAAQQTLGNVFAGTVLISARPFTVGERVRLQAGAVGGQVEGVVSALGLLYTALVSDGEVTMIPNSVVLNCVVIPLHEPDSVDLRARLPHGLTPSELRKRLEAAIETPMTGPPQVTLEELDGDEIVVSISATPQLAADGATLAGELLHAVARATRDDLGGAGVERAGADGTPAPVSTDV